MAVNKKAHQEAVKKYHDKANDNILVRFPKGTKERIMAVGKTVNGYINEAVYEKLERDEK